MSQNVLGPLCSNEYLIGMTGLNCIAALKALGEETRLGILRLLFKEPLSVNTISERLKASQYNVSKHLRIMREAGLLESQRQGKQRLYAVAENLKSELAANKQRAGPRLLHLPPGQAS